VREVDPVAGADLHDASGRAREELDAQVALARASVPPAEA
jgi:hypothetical protein